MAPMDGVQSAVLKAAVNKWISALADDKIDAVEKTSVVNKHTFIAGSRTEAI